LLLLLDVGVVAGAKLLFWSRQNSSVLIILLVVAVLGFDTNVT
jgi:hypothetical protein